MVLLFNFFTYFSNFLVCSNPPDNFFFPRFHGVSKICPKIFFCNAIEWLPAAKRYLERLPNLNFSGVNQNCPNPPDTPLHFERQSLLISIFSFFPLQKNWDHNSNNRFWLRAGFWRFRIWCEKLMKKTSTPIQKLAGMVGIQIWWYNTFIFLRMHNCNKVKLCLFGNKTSCICIAAVCNSDSHPFDMPFKKTFCDLSCYSMEFDWSTYSQRAQCTDLWL